MTVLRTPDECFANLPDFPYAPHYGEIPSLIEGASSTLRVHYIDEGRRAGPVVLMLHGEPTWSYLYRSMIAPLAEAGYRVVVPDLVGFGRSDKPAEHDAYTAARHVAWATSLCFDVLDLRDITLFAQDWGGVIGLRMLAERPDSFARVMLSNTGLLTGEGWKNEAFLDWQRFARESRSFPIGKIVADGCVRKLTQAEISAYDAPFPEDAFKAGARSFPSLVTLDPDDPAASANGHAWEVLRRYERPFLCAFSDQDVIGRGLDAPFRTQVPGARAQPHVTIEGARHFLQEDKGPELAGILHDFISRTSTSAAQPPSD